MYVKKINIYFQIRKKSKLHISMKLYASMDSCFGMFGNECAVCCMVVMLVSRCWKKLEKIMEKDLFFFLFVLI